MMTSPAHKTTRACIERHKALLRTCPSRGGSQTPPKETQDAFSGLGN
jgi:hypothetical protein